MKPEIWRSCCRDLRTYLEAALAGAKGGVVSVKLNRVLEVSRAHVWKRQYAWCLSRLLRSYKFGEVYLLTRRQAEELLNSLDALCAELCNAKKREKRQTAPPEEQEELAAETADGERMTIVSFYLPRVLLQALDEYARQRGVTRSDVVRMAIRQMLCPASPHPSDPLHLSVLSGTAPILGASPSDPPRGWGTPHSQFPRAESQTKDF